MTLYGRAGWTVLESRVHNYWQGRSRSNSVGNSLRPMPMSVGKSSLLGNASKPQSSCDLKVSLRHSHTDFYAWAILLLPDLQELTQIWGIDNDACATPIPVYWLTDSSLQGWESWLSGWTSCPLRKGHPSGLSAFIIFIFCPSHFLFSQMWPSCLFNPIHVSAGSGIKLVIQLILKFQPPKCSSDSHYYYPVTTFLDY